MADNAAGAGNDAGTGNTGGAPPWHAGIDAGVIGAWQNKGFDYADPKGLATKLWESYSNLESHLGVPPDRLIRLPKDAADAGAIAQMRAKLGVPNEAKDYDFAGIKFTDGTDLEAGFSDTMRGALHRAGVTKDTAPEIVKAVVNYLDTADAAEGATRAAALAQEKADLAKSWGPAAEMNRLQAMQAVKRLGIDPDTVNLLESQIGYGKVMEMFRKIGAGTSEDTFVSGGRSDTGDGKPATAEAAQARLKELKADKAWGKRLFAGDAATKREFDGLMQQIAGYVA